MDNGEKISNLRTLAREFREKAQQTELPDYKDLMLRAAAELDEYADRLEGRAVPPGPKDKRVGGA
jgi:hypothetical protein